MSKILIVDDNLANREILRLRLERLGHEVIEAVDGEEGLLSAEAHSPALIFLDVMMPKKNGWQVCRDLKGNPKTQSTPIVMLTALHEHREEFQSHECGADDYMTKPWAPENLKTIVAKWLAA